MSCNQPTEGWPVAYGRAALGSCQEAVCAGNVAHVGGAMWGEAGEYAAGEYPKVPGVPGLACMAGGNVFGHGVKGIAAGTNLMARGGLPPRPCRSPDGVSMHMVGTGMASWLPAPAAAAAATVASPVAGAALLLPPLRFDASVCECSEDVEEDDEREPALLDRWDAAAEEALAAELGRELRCEVLAMSTSLSGGWLLVQAQ